MGTMIDLGCGTGQIALRMFDWFDTVLGIDTEIEMLKEAEIIKSRLRISNVTFFHGNLNDYCETKIDSNIKLVTLGKSFHWLNRKDTLEMLYEIISPNGGVAIIELCSK